MDMGSWLGAIARRLGGSRKQTAEPNAPKQQPTPEFGSRAFSESIKGDTFDDYMDQIADKLGGKWMHASIAGASHRNEDGSSRQEQIARLQPNQQLFFASDFSNPHDRDAVRLVTADHHCVGFVPSWLNRDIAASIRKGRSPICLVKSVGCSNGPWGASLGIAWN